MHVSGVLPLVKMFWEGHYAVALGSRDRVDDDVLIKCAINGSVYRFIGCVLPVSCGVSITQNQSNGCEERGVWEGGCLAIVREGMEK